jgi:hypothetical protein
MILMTLLILLLVCCASHAAPGVTSRRVALTGRTCPWNTFAIWRTHELGFLGFPIIGDGTGADRSIGGVEVSFV